jgi:hypothetical protein
MFVEVGFQAGMNGTYEQELMVPSAAVQRIENTAVVFIPKDDEPGAFEVKAVELGGEVSGYHGVMSGLKLGDKVVTKGSFTLKTPSSFSEELFLTASVAALDGSGPGTNGRIMAYRHRHRTQDPVGANGRVSPFPKPNLSRHEEPAQN